MNVAIRVDASSQIGTGHFMRCLTLADALSLRGAAICFISRHLPDYLREILSEKGYEYIFLEGRSTDPLEDDLAHSYWLECSQKIDAQDTVQVLSDRNCDWLIVDHYALDVRWESTLRQSVSQILVLDDIADRQHDCDILLDQNFYTDKDTRYADKVPKHCRLLLGPRYALLRDEFLQLRKHIKLRKGPVKRILVFFGGVDAQNHTGRVIKILFASGIKGLLVDVVIGAQHPYREQIEILCSEMQFTCHVQTGNMALLMAQADLSIGAGGTATWERCCLGLSSIVIATADNQIRQIGDAAAVGLLYAPEKNEDIEALLGRHVCALMENSNLRKLISHHAMCAVDGRGVLRVIRKMGCSRIEIRVATEDDAGKLFTWRNNRMIRLVSRNSEEIKWIDHQEWYASVLSSPDKVLLIGEYQNLSVGVVRCDIQGRIAELSIYVVPDVKLTGVGPDLLQSAEAWLEKFRPEIREIKAEVLGGNERSQYLFLGADYQVEYTAYVKRLYDQESRV